MQFYFTSDLCASVECWMERTGLYGQVSLIFDHASKHSAYFLPKSGLFCRCQICQIKTVFALHLFRLLSSVFAINDLFIYFQIFSFFHFFIVIFYFYLSHFFYFFNIYPHPIPSLPRSLCSFLWTWSDS